MNLFKIEDYDGESLGLLKTDATYEVVDHLYDEFCTADDEDLYDMEEFVIFCSISKPDYIFERIFIDDVISPPQK